MQLLIYELPRSLTGSDIVLRHWLIFPDGRVFYQDELIRDFDAGIVSSTRTDWAELPTPEVTPPIIGLIDFGGMPLAMRSNGQAYIWGRELGEGASVLESWIPFLEAVPYEAQKKAEYLAPE